MNINAHRTLRISLAALLLLLLLAIQSFAAQTYTVRKGETLNLIAKKFNTTAAALQSANHLKSPNIIKKGQVLVIPSKQPSNPITYGRSTQTDLVVESGGKTITVLPKNTRFVVLSKEGSKYKIKLTDGRTGWVDAEEVVLEETKKPLPASDSSSMKNDLVKLAYSYRGARYRRGGMSSRGFDCSGFVKYLYATKGIKLPHDSRALYKQGKPVAKSDLQPGDILFFAGTYRRGISHVGLYVGDGKFIHASTPSRGVRLDYLNTAYYRSHYAGAKRINTPN